MLFKTVASPQWAPLLKVNWMPRSYEIVLGVFALIVSILVYGFSPLPFSANFARIFTLNLAEFVLAVYGLATLIVGFRVARHCWEHGWHSCRRQDNLISLVLPYFSLDFLLLSIRRAFSILAIIYFFLHLKHIVLLINTRNYDLFYWDLDRLLHGGIQPNILMMQLIGPNPEWSILIDYLYIKYFSFKILVSLFFMLELKGRWLSERFFLAYALLWALGGMAYLITPADGPCFAVLTNYAVEQDDLFHVFKFPVTTAIPASYIDNYLNAKIPSAKGFQILLWEARHIFLAGKGLPGMFYGIAAMPSLHVAAVTMLAIFLYQAYPVMGIIGALFGLTTFIGSLFLQWHYAVDGYIGFAGAVLCSALCLRGNNPDENKVNRAPK